jgi:hypothetical protein
LSLIRAIAEHREAIRLAVIAQYEEEHRWEIFEDGVFRMERYAVWLRQQHIHLPTTGKTHQPTKDEKVLEHYADKYPPLSPLRDCLRTLSALSRFKLPETTDGRSRFFANNFATVTGRNAPPASEFLFLLPGWAKFLIKPDPGWGVAYLDISGQEVVIGAAQSGDARMLHDYYHDIYLQQAVKQGWAPTGATRPTYDKERDRAKPLVLGINYGQTEFGLKDRLQVSQEEAAERIAVYMRSYPDFDRQRRRIANGMRRHARYFTSLGWPFWICGAGSRQEQRNWAAIERAMFNHPIQSSGADMMRIIMIAATEAGILVCCAVHDGFLITAPLDRLDEDIKRMTVVIKAAGAVLLGEEVLIGKPQIARWPDRFIPEDKKNSHRIWNLILDELERLTGHKHTA